MYINDHDTLTKTLDRVTQVLDRLTNEKAGGEGSHQKHDSAISGGSTYTPLHGPGGIWSGPLERDIITAHVRPYGLAGQLPLIPTVYTNPLFGVLTGYTATTGAQPDKSCADAPRGYVKGCTLTAKLGLLRMDTQEIDIDDVMLRLHRGDFTDLMLRGRVLGLTNLHPSGLPEGEILNVVTASEMVTAGVNTERELVRGLWRSTVANGVMGPGLDVQIATGHVDAETGVACPAVDSDVKNFGYDLVGGTGRDIVEYLSMLEFYLTTNAVTMGLDPVSWAIVMRPELWFELTAIWPCAYNTTRCVSAMTGGAGAMTMIDGRENIAERDAMRNGLYIDINGNRYPVILDVGIFEHTNINNANVPAAQYASSIYMVPLTITGGFPVTYREYLDYSKAARDESFAQGKLVSWWTDNGVYGWSLSQDKWCYRYHLKTQQRVVLRTPHLAGRIDAVRYSPLQHLREGFPDSPYHFDGGVSIRGNDPNYQAPWMN